MTKNAHLSEIWYYPIKSCKGISVEKATIDRFGILYDRRWMLIDAQGDFMTQRSHPMMALINVKVQNHTLVLSAPGMETFAHPGFPEGEESLIHTHIFEDEITVVPMPQEFNEWISNFLSDSCRLVFMPDTAQRQIDLNYALTGQFTSLSDGFPLLVISEASLEDLNQKLEHQIPMGRFRPNLVIGGVEPYAEDRWERIQIGEVTFKVAKPCGRCTITTVDQEKGVFSGKEPLHTLSHYRKIGKKVCFGQNLIQLNQGEIKLSDPVEIFLKSDK